jgi:uncharacterized iron-regulated membrane protein
VKSLRKAIFWVHLATRLIAGLSIAIMSFTGVLLAFETEIVEWAERDARRVEASVDGARISLGELQARVREAQPELRAPAITIRNDPAAAITFSAGREGGVYVNPYTGEIRQPASTAVHGFMRVMLEWHRFLGRDGDSRPIGNLINGVCNLAFCALAVTGLYLWWPRNLSWRSIKSIAVLNWRFYGQARDFSWHNSIGLWCAPVLIVLTLTAVPISFRWGGNLIHRLVSEEPPAQAAPGSALPVMELTPPTPDARLPGIDTIIANVQREFPRWEQINLRTGAWPRGGRPSAAPKPAGPQSITVTIRESGAWPRTATTTLVLNPFTGGHHDR